MNLAKLLSTGVPAFVNAKLESTDWQASPSAGVTIPRDANGYPLEIPFTPPGGSAQIATCEFFDLTTQAGTYPGGTYKLLFEGDGTLRLIIPGSGVVDFDHDGVGEFSADVAVTAGSEKFSMGIIRSAVADPLVNIRFLMPGTLGTYLTNPIYPPFVTKLVELGASDLRVMEWMRQNQQDEVDFADRVPATYHSMATGRGCCYELIAELIRRTGMRGWWSVPSRATQGWVEGFAAFWLAEFVLGETAKISPSNEISFPGKEQASYARDQGFILWPLLNPDDPLTARCRWVAKFASMIFSTLETELGAEAGRIEYVVDGQASNIAVATALLDALVQTSIDGVDVNPTQIMPGALSIAPYIGAGLGNLIVPELPGITETEIIRRMREDYLPVALQRVADHKSLATARGIAKLDIYEGGQNLIGTGANAFNATLTAKLVATNRHQDMFGLYQLTMEGYRTNGADAICPYSAFEGYDFGGSYGALEHLEQPLATAHKYRAIQEFFLGAPAGPAPAETQGIDNEEKRRSVQYQFCGFGLPVPDSDLDVADRLHMLRLYSGNQLLAPTTRVSRLPHGSVPASSDSRIRSRLVYRTIRRLYGEAPTVQTSDIVEAPPPEPEPPPGLAAMATANIATGMGPNLGVFFDVDEDVTLPRPPDEGPDNVPDLAKYHYAWNFDDDVAEFWTVSGKPKNTADGFNAGHLFKDDGAAADVEHVVQLAITTDLGVTTFYEQTITVTPYSGTHHYFDSVAGDDLNDGLTEGAPKKLWDAYDGTFFGTDGPKMAHLKAGQTHAQAAASSVVGRTGPFIITRYGAGDNPLLSYTTGANPCFTIDKTTTDVRIVDVDTDGNVTGDLFRPGQRCLLLRGVHDGNDHTVITSEANGLKSGFFCVEARMEAATSYNIYFKYGEHCAYLGNYFGGAVVAVACEHCFRSYNTQSVIQHNEFTNWDAGKHGLKAAAWSPTGGVAPPAEAPTEGVIRLIVSDNLFHTPQAGSSHALWAGPIDNDSDDISFHYVIERNRMLGSTDSSTVAIMVNGSYHTVRLNLIDATAKQNWAGVRVQQRGTEDPPRGVHVYSNTLYSGHAAPTFVCVNIQATATNCEAKNNASFRTAGSGGTTLSNQGVNTTESNNPTPLSSSNLVNPSSGDFHLTSAIGQAVQIPQVQADYDDVALDATPDVGAYQFV